MPFKSGKSPKDVARKINLNLNNVAKSHVKNGVKAVAFLIADRADKYVPIDTNDLLSSRRVKVTKTDLGWRATIGYYEEYASALHSPRPGSKMDGWRPRPPDAPGKKAGGYNPAAKQDWINIGFNEVWPKLATETFRKKMIKK